MIATMNDSCVHWLDGMGISKEHRMHTESGSAYVSGHFTFTSDALVEVKVFTCQTMN